MINAFYIMSFILVTLFSIVVLPLIYIQEDTSSFIAGVVSAIGLYGYILYEFLTFKSRE